MDMTRHYNDYSSAADGRTWWLNSPANSAAPVASNAVPCYAFCLFENSAHLAAIGLRHS